MRNKVYRFTPKGAGYNVYATKTYHNDRTGGSSTRVRRKSDVSNIFVDMIARGIARAIFRKRR